MKYIKIVGVIILSLLLPISTHAASFDPEISSVLTYDNKSITLQDGELYTLYQDTSIEIELTVVNDENEGFLRILTNLEDFSGPLIIQVGKNEKISLKFEGKIPKSINEGKNGLPIINEKKFLLFQVTFEGKEVKNLLSCYAISTTPETIEAKKAIKNLESNLKKWTPKSSDQKEIVENLFASAKTALSTGDPVLAKNLCYIAMKTENIPLAVIFSDWQVMIIGIIVGIAIGFPIAYPFLRKYRPKEEHFRLGEVR